MVRLVARPSALPVNQRRRSGQRSDHPRAWGGIGHWTWTLGSWNALEVVDALDPGVVVLVPILIGGTCMPLRHDTFPFLVIISKGVSIAVLQTST